MPLLAIDTSRNNCVLDLTKPDEHAWADVWRQRTGDRLRCRSCSQPLVAKEITRTKLRFFAHAQEVSRCPTHGETARHLQLKALFAGAFRSAGWTADLE